jgi:hypothetical protein
MQTTTLTLFRFDGFKNRYWAFGQMGKRPIRPHFTEGVHFAKMLGTGGGNGFSIFPNFGQYAWLNVWDTEGVARQFFEKHPLYQTFQQRAKAHLTIYLRPTMAHGQWNKTAPFEVNNNFDPVQPVAVLTRARIKNSLAHRFWQYVPQVSRSVEPAEGRILSVGVGELPLIEQATFSLWQSGKQMMDYAYKSRYHAEVVKKTRELGWYSEELFARFSILGMVGDRDAFLGNFE